MVSDKFKHEVINYLSADFINEQMDEITRKLFGLVKKWKAGMNSHNIDVFKALCKSIETDAKFKLPWTVKEIRDAVEMLIRLSNKGVNDGK